MPEFYPLKFYPIYKPKIWGGNKIKSVMGKDYGALKNCGESWELSCVTGDVSIVANGNFKGESLDHIIQNYPGQILGNYSALKTFPLLIKFLDANDDLSVQVHPDDAIAQMKHNGFGKTEMWYIIDADPGAEMYVGFREQVGKDSFLQKASAGKIMEVICREPVRPGDVFYIPAGRIHSIGKGILLAEIQQTSDITYRIYDFDRLDDDGKPRDLHLEAAADALKFDDVGTSFKVDYDDAKSPTTLVQSVYFITRLIKGKNEVSVSPDEMNSFRILIVIHGNGKIHWQGGRMEIALGDVILIPAAIKNYTLNTYSDFCGLEVSLE